MTTKLIKLHEVTRITSLSRSTIYQAIIDGRFPKPFRTGARGRRVKKSEPAVREQFRSPLTGVGSASRYCGYGSPTDFSDEPKF